MDTPISIKKISVILNRHIKKEDVDPSVRQGIAYGLALFPSEAKVVDGFMQNESSSEQIAEVEDALEEPLGEMADDLQEEIETAGRDGLHAAKEEVAALMPPGLTSSQSVQESSSDETAEKRRLAEKEFDSFIIHLHTNRHITSELLRSLAHDGAFRIRDGRERTHGEIRIKSIGLYEPKPQQLWARVPAGAKAPAAATSWGTAAFAALAALSALTLVGLSSARFFSRQRTYQRMPEA
eukprot:CAMPEP_0171066016 /NCGR_PEP_ID=MMETSP0766_2-20121228/7179_1 /TAXON_ID=439317 /ORGANISM="Gambierdiscus australes, Strain CAWD 149" /LENGTH=237 /DNA_ID=CAMNT_0011522161 /DNA_START=1 /DNA_END=714 /DNA_ORIENTATION=-